MVNYNSGFVELKLRRTRYFLPSFSCMECFKTYVQKLGKVLQSTSLAKLLQKANTINLQTIADARLFCKSQSLIYVNENRDNLVRTLLQTSLALCVFPVRLYYTGWHAIALYFRSLIFCTTWSICAIINFKSAKST